MQYIYYKITIGYTNRLCGRSVILLRPLETPRLEGIILFVYTHEVVSTDIRKKTIENEYLN